MSLFDIIGPVMVGPSSSHTAGATRIGYIAQRLLGAPVKKAIIYLHGSFALTGEGHGTDKALIGGLLGMHPDDERLPKSFELAKEQGILFEFHEKEIRGAHPNTVEMDLFCINGRSLNIVASSIGGGRIKVCQIDGLDANFNGDLPTLIVHNQDQPGHVAKVTSALSAKNVNIATMQLYRDNRGGNAVMVIECDQEIPTVAIKWLERLEGVDKVTYLSLQDGNMPESNGN